MSEPKAPPAGAVAPHDLYLRAYDDLKKEIAELVKDERSLERTMLLASGAIWTYLAGHDHPTEFPHYLWYVPVVLVLFGAARAGALMIAVHPRAQYLRAIERTLDGLSLEGWEEYFRHHYRRGVGLTLWLFWLGLFVATLVAPCVLGGASGDQAAHVRTHVD